MAVSHDLFFALGDPTRLKIIDRLIAFGPHATIQLATYFKMSRQGATKHMRVLEKAGLIKSWREGRFIMRSLNSERLLEASAWLAMRAQAWDERLEALQRYVEEE